MGASFAHGSLRGGVESITAASAVTRPGDHICRSATIAAVPGAFSVLMYTGSAGPGEMKNGRGVGVHSLSAHREHPLLAH